MDTPQPVQMECLVCGEPFFLSFGEPPGCSRCRIIEAMHPAMYSWIRDVVRVALVDHLHETPHGRQKGK